MGSRWRRILGVLVAALIVGSACSPTEAADGRPEPQLFFQSAMREIAQYRTPEGGTGESFCWHAAFYLRHFVRGYKAYNDRAWLDYGVMYYDALVGAMATGPDGYKGWIGPFIYDKRVWCDVHVGDAVLVEGMLEFAELVLADAELAKRYGAKAKMYVKVAAKDVIAKWDARGTWREDGPYGGYVSWNKYGAPGQFADWRERPDVGKSTLSLPFNKQNHMGVVCLRLWRITGETKYRDQAEKIFLFMRSRFQYFDDHYVWNYWEPMGPWDIVDGKPVHWIGVHPYRDYQAGEIGQIVEAYNSGVVFTKTDIQRIINTNLKVMWDGNKDRPEFRNSNTTIPGYTEAKPSKQYPGKAGTLWTALAQFDPIVRELYARRLAGAEPDSIENVYFKTVTCARPPSFQRTYVPDAPEPAQIDTGESAELIAACVLPAHMERGRSAFVLCKTLEGGDVRVSLYDNEGRREQALLYEGAMRYTLIRDFNGVVPAGQEVEPGDYRIRWTFKKGYREFPIRIGR